MLTRLHIHRSYNLLMSDRDKLDLAREQLVRVQSACVEPVDWLELTIFAFYALENAVVAAADHFQVPWKPTHPSKVTVAQLLAEEHGLPDIADLLTELNELRKSEAYGEVLAPTRLDPEDIASAVESYIDAVEQVRS